MEQYHMVKTSKRPSFLNDFNKKADTMKNVSSVAPPVKLFFDTGNCIVNKVISGRYRGGYPAGRMTMIAGLSGTGKSFLGGNGLTAALKAGFGCLVIDSENALDEDYLIALGVDLDNPLFDYKSVDSIDQVNELTAAFFKSYNSVPEDEQIPWIIFIDSLDQLDTASQQTKFEKGETANDQGQQAKQLKRMQSNIMHGIKRLPIAVVSTKQVYMNSDMYTKVREPVIITQALRFAYTQILLVTAKLLKDKKTELFSGINLEVYGFKTRLTKPYQKCIIEVPYEEGMDWYSGVLEAAVSLGIVTKNKAWYAFNGKKFQQHNFDKYKDDIFKILEEREAESIQYEIPVDELLTDE